jgi:predicted PurR-regulated permease PerM
MNDRTGAHPAAAHASWSREFGLTPASFYRALIIVLALWVLHGFLEAMLAAGVTAIASWSLYVRFADRMPARMRRGATPLIFTCLMVVLVLAPMAFAVGALLSEAHTLLQEFVTADQRGIVPPPWLADVPLIGPWMLARWELEAARTGRLTLWMQQADPALLLGWAQSLGEFTARQAIIIVFAILLLFYLYQQGDTLAEGARRMLRQRLGPGVEHYINLGTRALRASVNSMLLVGLFDGLALAFALTLAGVPRAVVWAAITGALALVPLLGYVAVAALALQLTITGSTTTAVVSLLLGSFVLLVGDKVVRPLVARAGVRLPFVWVLIGCLGGFEVLGLTGLVLGPVVLALSRELWEQRVREAVSADAAGVTEAAAPAALLRAAAALREASAPRTPAATPTTSTSTGSSP